LRQIEPGDIVELPRPRGARTGERPFIPEVGKRIVGRRAANGLIADQLEVDLIADQRAGGRFALHVVAEEPADEAAGRRRLQTDSRLEGESAAAGEVLLCEQVGAEELVAGINRRVGVEIKLSHQAVTGERLRDSLLRHIGEGGAAELSAANEASLFAKRQPPDRDVDVAGPAKVVTQQQLSMKRRNPCRRSEKKSRRQGRRPSQGLFHCSTPHQK
jgi:hypothetical protein